MEIEGTDSQKESNSIEINTKGVERGWEKTTSFLKKKNVQIIITLVLFALILFSSVSIRLSGLPNLVDVTTGHYVLADPDAFYELRVAQTIVNTGNINGIDSMRNPGLNLTYTQEMLPMALANAYKILHSVNSSITLDYIDVLYPVVAFALSLIIFFILCWYFTKSKALSILASLMLAYSTTYLERTGVGISSHEALGMIFFFLSLLIYFISVNSYKKNWKNTIIWGVATGVSLALSLFSWSGGSNFLVMIFPIFAVTYYLFGIRDEDKTVKKRFIGFNFIWVFSAILMMPIISYPISTMTSRLLSNYGVAVPFAIAFMAIDYFLENYSHKIKAGQSHYRILYSLCGTILLGIIGLIGLGKNPLNVISDIYTQLIYPFGHERVSLTVAYFAQPYLNDIISQIGSSLFWVFFLGLILIGVEFGKNISKGKYKTYFYIIWILAISGMLFTRISSSSFFNGTNFISVSLYILSFLILGSYLIILYLKEKFTIDNKTIFLFSWMIVMLMSARSAVRVLFIIMTFIFIIAAYFTIKIYEYGKKAKDNSWKYLFIGLAFIALLITLFFVFGNPLTGTPGSYQNAVSSEKYSGPITNQQWQYAMSWVRNSTSPDSVFVSWWDYGYLIQTLGNRTTVVDGGNANVYWDHMVGRYLLTEPNANASLSFMKTHNVSYLLIDPTDIGKYSAFSTIGSDVSGQDRASYIPSMALNPSQTQETNDSEILFYQGGLSLDQDIVYNQSDGSVVFLPKQTTVLAGIIVQAKNNGNSLSLSQAQAVFINTQSQKQISIPLRYAYFNNKLADFGGGLDAGIDIISSVAQTSTGSIQFNSMGALMYLSPKVFNSLFAQLYMMNDPFNKYSTIKVANLQEDPLVSSLKAQGASIGDFIYAGGGVRAPLEIWQVSYPSYIISRPEFMSTSGQFAAFDNLTFVS
ncbi:MAG: hypothetical protein ABSG05_01885 [Candidatus Pacearchaeota archaeon]|jgi:asparagine N-glycosylation enzyme membrane subunit Stt3